MVKSNDFEVHEIGTALELKLCRALVEDMNQVSKQYGRGILPSNVVDKLNKLNAFYADIINNKGYENGI